MKYKLICFDVDGTLVDNIEYSWELFHNYFEIDKNRRIKARDMYYKGEISYLQWAQHDINMWIEKKATKKDFFKAMKSLKLMKGAIETLVNLKLRGFKLAIISGSLDVILEKLLPNYKEIFDDVFLSYLTFDKDGVLIGAKATEYDMEHKATALKKIAEREGLSLSECVFIGDHHNDLKIMEEVGFGIAFDAKDDRLKEVADVVIDGKDLREVLRYI